MQNKIVRRCVAALAVITIGASVSYAVHSLYDSGGVSKNIRADDQEVRKNTDLEQTASYEDMDVRKAHIDQGYAEEASKLYSIRDDGVVTLKQPETTLSLPLNLSTIREDDPDGAKFLEGSLLPKDEGYAKGMLVEKGQTLIVPKGQLVIIGDSDEKGQHILDLALNGKLIIEDAAKVLVYGASFHVGDDAEIEQQGSGLLQHMTKQPRTEVTKIDDALTETNQLPNIKAIPNQTWTGQPVTPKIEIPGAEEGKDFKTEYSFNTNTGFADVKATAIGNRFVGEVSQTFFIKSPELPKANVTATDNGDIEIKVDIPGLEQGKDYEVSTSWDNTYINVLVNAIGNYSGSKVYRVDATTLQVSTVGGDGN
jgi:hypothetical protein